MSKTEQSFGAPSIMQHVGIPKYDPKNALHAKLGGLSKELHELVTAGENQSEIEKKEKEVNALVTDLFSNTTT